MKVFRKALRNLVYYERKTYNPGYFESNVIGKQVKNFAYTSCKHRII